MTASHRSGQQKLKELAPASGTFAAIRRVIGIVLLRKAAVKGLLLHRMLCQETRGMQVLKSLR